MVIDKQDLSLLGGVPCIYGHSNHGNRYAVFHRQGDHRHTGVHNIICPEWKEVDHINRNGLDNRRANLRDGSNGVNSKNKRLFKNNTTGENGIGRETRTDAWRVTWHEGSKRRAKIFSDSKFESKEEAFEAACLFRDQIDERLGITNGREPIQT